MLAAVWDVSTYLPELQSAAFNLAVALVCAALIGTERQARHRTAGLRTNALVALGAAAFVIFAARFTGEASPTRVAAQIVSGIGFLGAGIIYRDGFTVHGLNTAATLWCSAAVGMMAGTGAWHLAVLLTLFVMLINLGLRPLVRWIKRKTGAEAGQARDITITIRCKAPHEAETRRQMLEAFQPPAFTVLSMATKPADQDGMITVEAHITGSPGTGFMQIIHRLAGMPAHAEIKWEVDDDN